MKPFEDERAALGIHRARREAYPDHDDPTNRFRLQTDEAVTLADMALRLFPVRSYGEIVIRWDDEITPERLVACGFGPHPFNDSVLVSPPDQPNGLTYRPPQTWSLPWCDHSLDELTPRNMLEVWQLMERCGIEEGGK